MSLYLHDIPLQKAQELFNEALEAAGMCSKFETENIPLDEFATNRILSEPIWAKVSSPHYNAAAMDGYAVYSRNTGGASETKPLVLRYGESTIYLDTGEAIPDWANAIIPIENVEILDSQGRLISDRRKATSIRIRFSVPPWFNVRTMGEDIVATQFVFPIGHFIRPVDLGVIAACGYIEIPVVRQPLVTIIPTGSELVKIGDPCKAGEIIEFNSIVLAGQVKSWGAKPYRFGIVPDDFDLICEKVREASSYSDLILVNAGSSAGSKDHTANIVKFLGELLVHGVAVRPGHPVILGMVKRASESENCLHNRIPIVGIPGYPVSAALTGELFVKPLIERWLGIEEVKESNLNALITKKITSPAGDDDYLRVSVGKVGKRYLAAPLSRGAGVITSLSKADGIVILPRGVQGVSAGEEVDVHLYRTQSEIESTIFCIGSHDITLDILSQHLFRYKRRLTSANVGSIGGLTAIKRDEAHIAGIHLLDLESGEYNKSYVRQYLPELPVVLITLVGRQQGLVIKRGNPNNINTFLDLQREDIVFVNRQRGSGTRILLDYHLKLDGISPEKINGYDHEEYTHLAVAAAVDSGRASCGLGIAAAAAALGLDFVPLFEERYDLVIPQKYYQGELLNPMLTILSDNSFHKEISNLPGYDTRDMGKIVALFT